MMIKTPQHLYSDTPPTVLRNREEKFRTAKDSRFWFAVADYIFKRMIESRFHSLMFKGFENFETRDKSKATLFYTNHNKLLCLKKEFI